MLNIPIIIISVWSFFSCITPSKNEEPPPVRNLHEQVSDTLVWDKPRFSERKKEREQMVIRDIQNYPYGPVTDSRVLDAMKAVPRHKFVPDQYQDYAYVNFPLPIGYGQTISQPLIVAYMTELLNITPGDKILEIGTGSGYQAAVLSELTPYVFTVEIIEKLGLEAIERFRKLGYNTIRVKIGDGYEGWDEYAPYDGIIVTCAPEEIPAPLIRQLKPSGKIVIPIGKANQIQMLMVVEKNKNGNLKKYAQYPVRFVPMIRK